MSAYIEDGIVRGNAWSTITIASGVATITTALIKLAAESGTTDTLDSLSLNMVGISTPYLVWLMADTGDTITVAINGTNIKTGGSATTVTLTGNTVIVGLMLNNVLTLLNADVATSAVDWTRPGTIGSNTPNTGAFTTLSSSGVFANDTNLILTDPTNNLVGINKTPTSILDVTGTVTGQLGISFTPSVTANAANLAGISFIPVITASSTQPRGFVNAPSFILGAAIGNLYASRTTPIITSGAFNITTWWGNYWQLQSGASYSNTIGTAYAHYIDTPSNSAATWTTVYGMFINTQSAGATNNYGLYIAGASGGATLNRSLHVNAGEGYFGGDLIHNAGDLYWTTSGAGIPFGEIYVQGNSTATTISTQNVWVKFALFGANGVSNLTTPDHTNDRVTVTKAGIYKWSCVFSIKGATLGKTYELTLQKTGSGTALTNFYATYFAIDTNYQIGSLAGLITLAASDYLELFIRCTDATTANATISDANLNCIMIGA